MQKKPATPSDEKERELIITRILNAPRALVFEAWTDPTHVSKWWAPNGFTNTVHEMDVRPGGIFRFTMHGPDGVDQPNVITYIEVIKPKRLRWIHGTDIPDAPGEAETTVDFKADGTRTHLTIRLVFKTKEERTMVVEQYGALESSHQTINRLEEYLKTLN